MKLDTKLLRDLARDATPGPWSVSKSAKGTTPNGAPYYLILDGDRMWVADVGPAPKDAAFIAACSPEVIVALLDEVEARSDRTLRMALSYLCSKHSLVLATVDKKGRLSAEVTINVANEALSESLAWADANMKEQG